MSVAGTAPPCPACGSGAIAAVHIATERMYGMGGEFGYRECATCASLALNDVPSDLARYYPPGYYSFTMPIDHGGQGSLAGIVRRWATRVALASPTVTDALGAAGHLLGRRVPGWTSLLTGLGLGIDAELLDVGCGDGHRLRTLRRHGFRHLTGSDPNLGEVVTEEGLHLTPARLEDLAGPFDVVMFHHSLEHVADAHGALVAARSVLKADGAVVVRLPLAGCWAWRTYGTRWVQLDAPRHQFLPTPGGLHLLAARSGLRIARVLYDSDGFQLWGSEQYRQGAPLHHPGTDAPPESGFDPRQLEGFERQAAELNARGDGDQAAFLLRPTAGVGLPAMPAKPRSAAFRS